ncbi:MAG TPA: UbiA family prenyltransferase [Streptosporangiaceae bacterium]|nr:UbiA family prenyltransferase [Streptosporangiaceae bacterium]
MGVAERAWALVRAGHPGPSLAISALIAVLAAQAAPHGAGPVALVVPAVVAGQFSIGWSNDFFDAGRDATAGRGDKPVVTGGVSRRAAGVAGVAALAASLVLGLAIGAVAGLVNAVMMAAGWAYNAGLKSTLASGLTYMLGFGLIPAFAASTLPGHPAPRALVTAAAAVLGLGAHFANVIHDLDGDRLAGVRGLPQRVAARFGPGAVRLTALVLLLAASALLALSAAGPHRWVSLAGLGVAVVAATAGAASPGRLPFLAAIIIGAIDVALFVFGGVILV